ncbi:MAG: hypothetical protein OXR73_05585 [Myxococcales bacterium]|nr:hypothetical protein [Myxococcales bacterium]
MAAPALLLDALVGRDGATTAKPLWHLGEVDRDEGYSTLFEYWIKKLQMSEGEAARRIRAARLSRRFPVVISTIAHLHDQIRQARDLLRHQVPDGGQCSLRFRVSRFLGTASER